MGSSFFCPSVISTGQQHHASFLPWPNFRDLFLKHFGLSAVSHMAWLDRTDLIIPLSFFGSIHFSRGQNRKSRSSAFLCSKTKRKRLLRRLIIWRLRFAMPIEFLNITLSAENFEVPSLTYNAEKPF